MSSDGPANDVVPVNAGSGELADGAAAAAAAPSPSAPGLKSTLSVGQSLLPERSEQGASSLAFYTKCIDSVVHDYLCENLKASEVIEKVRSLNTPIFADVFVLRSIQHVVPMGESRQADVAQLLTIAYDSRIFSRLQCTRAFEKLLQQAVGFKQLDVDGSIEEALFAFFTAAADDGWIDLSFLSRLPEYFVKNLPPVIREADPVLVYNAERLRKYKQACVKVVEDALAEGSSDTIVDFLQAAEKNGEDKVDLPTVIVPPITNDLIKHEFVRRLLANGISSNSPSVREMVSKTLSDLYGTYLTPDDVQLGVVRLLASLEDLVLDCPDASNTLSKFIVRMYVDDVLCPSFVNDFLRISLGDHIGSETLRRAFRWMTSGRRVLAQKFSKIWTSTEPYRPEVEQFRKDLKEIVYDFLNTGDIEMAINNIQLLEMTPDQEVQALRKAIIYTMERRQEEWGMIIALIEALVETREIEVESVNKALQEIQDRIIDIRLDNPLVDQALAEFFYPQLCLISKIDSPST